MLNSTHKKEYKQKKSGEKKWRSVVQINEQGCVWKNNRKIKKSKSI